MEIVKFLDKTWQEIPEQDNPCMGHIRAGDGSLINQECIIIFKGKYPLITNGGFVVAVNPLHGDIISKGVFWRSESAEIFARGGFG